MKRINVLILVASLLTLGILTESCQESEEMIDPCSNITCQNNGTCENGTCDCPDGYLGANCESIDTTKIQFLLDGGTTPQTLYEGGVTLDQLYGKIYADGFIFYLNTDNGKGLVAATENQSAAAVWGCERTDIMDLINVTDVPNGPETIVGTRIFDGMPNTNAILAACVPNDGIAAKLCRDLGEEWFLPSRGELNLMYTNLHKNGHGDFAPDFYWSSTENTSISAWKQNFTDGDQNVILKLSTVHVRAARAF